MAGFCLAAAAMGPAWGEAVPVYPAGPYLQSGQPLLQPGENPADRGPIILHMPSRKAAAGPRARAQARTEPKTAVAPGLPSQPSPQVAKPAPRPKQVAKAEPAKPAPSATDAVAPGLTKRSVILFAAGASDPAQSALGAIKYLAGDLTSAMTGPSARIQLQAYGGTRGDKGSDARRLSLKRALAIRQVLIDDGVPADRIDVHAAGGADDNGPADRVDVYIKA